MSSPQQYEAFLGNASPIADARWSTTAFPALHRPQSPPSSYRRPVPGQPRGNASVVRDVVPPPANAAGNNWPDWENIPPSVERSASRVQPQDLRHVNMGYYDMANGHPQAPLHEHREHTINNYAGVALDIPAQAQAQAQAAPAPIGIFDGPDRNGPAGPARAFPDEWPPQDRVPNGPANEVLRQLAILYMREPNSQVVVIRMEPGYAHGVRVVIALELADL